MEKILRSRCLQSDKNPVKTRGQCNQGFLFAHSATEVILGWVVTRTFLLLIDLFLFYITLT